MKENKRPDPTFDECPGKCGTRHRSDTLWIEPFCGVCGARKDGTPSPAREDLAKELSISEFNHANDVRHWREEIRKREAAEALCARYKLAFKRWAQVRARWILLLQAKVRRLEAEQKTQPAPPQTEKDACPMCGEGYCAEYEDAKREGRCEKPQEET